MEIQRKEELVGQVIDIFEDFLENKGVNIDNPEKSEAVAVATQGGIDESECAILYGSDYDELAF